MRAVSVHEDAIVVTSLFWQLNAVALRAGDEAMLIDSPYFPEELELLPAVLAQSGFEPVALLATHADFDHVLGRMAFPDAVAGGGRVDHAAHPRLPGGGPAGAARPRRRASTSSARGRCRWARPSRCRCPGDLGLGEHELELHPTGGHTSDGMAVFAPWMGVLVAGDYLSPVEIPMISPGGSLAEYRGTLAALAPVVERARTVVPGHGAALDRDAALRLIEEDGEYLDALERGEERPRLPEGRDSGEQRRIHTGNLERDSA